MMSQTDHAYQKVINKFGHYEVFCVLMTAEDKD
jgi:hypothetical protein